MTALERTYTVAEAAEILHLHRRTVSDMCRNRLITVITSYDRTGRSTGYLIPESALVDYQRSRIVPAITPGKRRIA